MDFKTLAIATTPFVTRRYHFLSEKRVYRKLHKLYGEGLGDSTIELARWRLVCLYWKGLRQRANVSEATVHDSALLSGELYYVGNNFATIHLYRMIWALAFVYYSIRCNHLAKVASTQIIALCIMYSRSRTVSAILPVLICGKEECWPSFTSLFILVRVNSRRKGGGRSSWCWMLAFHGGRILQGCHGGCTDPSCGRLLLWREVQWS